MYQIPAFVASMKHITLTLLAVTYLTTATLASELVNFVEPAMPVSRMLPMLSRLCGKTLEADAILQREVVLVSVEDVDSQVLLNRVAECLSAKWQPTDNGLKLCLLPEKERIQRKTVLPQEAEALKQAISRTTARYGPDSPSTISRKQPDSIYQILALTSIPVAEYLTIEPNSMARYAYPPNRNEAALPKSIFDSVQSYLAEQTDSGPMEKLLVEVSRVGWKDFSCRPYAILRTNSYICIGNGISFGFDSLPRNVSSPVNDDIDIHLSSSRPELAKYLSALFKAESNWSGYGHHRYQGEIYDVAPFSLGGTVLPVLDLKSVSTLGDPVSNEPLQFAGEVISAYAKSLRTNVVACLPDWCLGPACEDLAAGNMKSQLLYDRFVNEWRLSLDKDDSWLIVRPYNPALCRKSRLRREALANLIALSSRGSGIALDEFAKYCAVQPDGLSRDHFESLWLYRLAPELSGRLVYLSNGGDRRVYKLFGMLTDSQRSALRQGKSIDFTSLNSDQRSQYIRSYAVLDLVDNFDLEDPYVYRNSRYSLMSEIMPQMNSAYGKISAAVSILPIYYGIASSGERVPVNHLFTMIVPFEIVAGKAFDTFDALGPRLQYPSYQKGEKECLKLDLILPSPIHAIKEFRYRYVLSGDHYDPSARTYLYKELEPKVINWIERQVESLRNIVEGMNQSEKKPTP